MGYLIGEKLIDFVREAGVFPEDPVRAAQDVLILEQLKELLVRSSIR
jgi:hypothetical protein